jgi:hypothetical protein
MGYVSPTHSYGTNRKAGATIITFCWALVMMVCWA